MPPFMHNLVHIPGRESLEDFHDQKSAWLEEMVGREIIDWRIISTGYIWFSRKEDKIMFILKWGE